MGALTASFGFNIICISIAFFFFTLGFVRLIWMYNLIRGQSG
jgi:hypothetical protein